MRTHNTMAIYIPRRPHRHNSNKYIQQYISLSWT